MCWVSYKYRNVFSHKANENSSTYLTILNKLKVLFHLQLEEATHKMCLLVIFKFPNRKFKGVVVDALVHGSDEGRDSLR